jgi:hypothetical protein
MSKNKKYIVLDWLNFLLEFNFYVVHRKRIANLLLNALLRNYRVKKKNEIVMKILKVKSKNKKYVKERV